MVHGEPVVLKDQRPLIEANVAPTDGWEFGDLVEFLNGHVFFWPGDAIGPDSRAAASQRITKTICPQYSVFRRQIW